MALLVWCCLALPLAAAEEEAASEYEALYPADKTAVVKLWPRNQGYGWRYLVQVDVGTPPQALFLLLDTGSHQLLLRDAARGACSPSEPPTFGSCFNSSASTSITDNNEDVTVFDYVVDVDVDLNGRYRTAHDRIMLDGAEAPEYGVLYGFEDSSASSRAYISAYVALLEAVSRGGIGPVEDVPRFLADASGVLGVSHWDDGPWQSLLRLLTGATDRFALDLNRGGESRLVLGGTYSAADVAWSEIQAAPDFHELLLFAPSICGARLLGETAGWWLALVDTGSSCLSLPADLFYGLFRWISPSLRECSFDLDGGDAADADANADADADANASATAISGRRCHLPRGADAATLPALSFRVSQAGRLLTLPLEELLLPQQADGRREFCIRSQARTAANAGKDEPSREVPILLGTQALHGFVTVFEMASRKARVGLLPKRRPAEATSEQASEEAVRVNTPSEEERYPAASEDAAERRWRRREGCAARPQCVGQQHYTSATNTCEPPKCAARYLRAYDAATGSCQLSPSFEALAVVLLVAFALAELTLQEWQTRLPLASAQGEEEEEDEDEDDAPGGREGGTLPDSALRRRQRQSWGDGPDA